MLTSSSVCFSGFGSHISYDRLLYKKDAGCDDPLLKPPAVALESAMPLFSVPSSRGALRCWERREMTECS